MAVPIQRRYTFAAPAALNAFALASDNITNLTFTQTNRQNAILDAYSDPHYAAAERYEIRMMTGGIENGVAMFTDGMNPATAGRSAVGPIDIKGNTQISYNVAQRATGGGLAAYNFVIKYANRFN